MFKSEKKKINESPPKRFQLNPECHRKLFEFVWPKAASNKY